MIVVLLYALGCYLLLLLRGFVDLLVVLLICFTFCSFWWLGVVDWCLWLALVLVVWICFSGLVMLSVTCCGLLLGWMGTGFVDVFGCGGW